MVIGTQKTSVEISTKTILMVIGILLIIGFIFVIRDIVFLLFLALMFAAAIDQPIDWLNRKGVPRAIGVIFIYLIVLSLFAVSIALIIPPIAEQLRGLAEAIPSLFEKLGILVGTPAGQADNVKSVLSTIGNTFATSTGAGLFSTISGIFGGFFSMALVMVLTFYLVVHENGMKRFVRSLVPVKNIPYAMSLINRIQFRIGGWLRGQLLLALIIFLLTYAGLLILDVPYALILAIAAGLMEIIPYIGPIIAAIPAVLLAFGDDPLKAVFVIVFYVVVQQLENHIFVPKIMQKAVGLNPVTIILALLIGAKLAGVVGLLLAIPVATAVGEFVGDFLKNDEEKKSEAES